MKKLTKRITGFALALVVTLSLSTVAFASGNVEEKIITRELPLTKGGSITINIPERLMKDITAEFLMGFANDNTLNDGDAINIHKIVHVNPHPQSGITFGQKAKSFWWTSGLICLSPSFLWQMNLLYPVN